MNKKPVFLLLNGEPPKHLPNMANYALICVTDGAYDYLKAHAVTPNFISGDFDSVKDFPSNIEVIHTPNQDLTDFDKILKIIFDRGYTNIHVYGASGREQDHFLGNLHTAIHWKSNLNLTFFDNYGYYFLAKSFTELSGCNGKTVSLVPLPNATNVVTKGLQYPLNNESLKFGHRIGTRNKAIAEHISVSYDNGILFIFINN